MSKQQNNGRRAEILPLNTIALGDMVFLRVTLAGGGLLHLATQTAELPVKRARAAVDARQRPPMPGVAHYDGSALAERLWSRHTLCQHEWSRMAAQADEIELAARAATAGRRGYACPSCAGAAISWAAA